MTEQDRLSMLKIDLGISTDAFDDRLKQYLQSAKAQIEREGVAFSEEDGEIADTDDNQLIVMYAAWTWRRRDGMDGMPRMLRYALNNRLFAGKLNG